MENAEGAGRTPKKKIDTKYIKIGVVAFVVIISVIIFYFAFFDSNTLFVFLQKVLDNLEPFAIGAILAYLLKPICAAFEKLTTKWFKKMKNRYRAGKLVTNLSICFTMISFAVFIYILFAAVIPQVIDSVKNLVGNAPQMFTSFIEWLKNLVKDNEYLSKEVENFSNDAMGVINKVLEKLISVDVGELVSQITVGVKGVLNFFTNLLVGIISCVYILAQRKKLAKQGTMLINSIFSPKWSEKVMDEIAYIDKMFSGFINGKIIDSIIIGFLTFIVVSIFKIPYAMLISVIVGVTNVIPFFGPFIGAIPSAFIVMIQDPIKGLYFIIIIIIIQQLDGNIIGPKILGNTTGLSSFWVLFSIMLFGGLFGFSGMLLGVPIFAVIYDVVRRIIKHGLAKWHKEDMYIEYEQEQCDEELARQEQKERRKKQFVRIKKTK